MRLYLMGTLLGLSAIAALNFFVDSDRLWFRASTPFVRSLEHGEVRVIRSAATTSREERVSQFAISPKPDLLLMGSSPSVGTSQELFSSKIKFFNLGVSGGSLEEYAAFWLIANELKHLPKYLVIQLEPSSFNESMQKGSQEWLRTSGYFEKIYKDSIHQLPEQSLYSKIKSRVRFARDKMVILFKWECLQRSLAYLVKWGRHSPPDFEVVKESEFPDDLYGYRSDGSMIYPKKVTTNLDQEKLKVASALMPDKKTDYLYLDYSRSEKHIFLLENISKMAEQLNVKVMVMVHPFHPAAYDHMQKTSEYASVIDDYRAVLKSVQSRVPSLSVCDVFEPSVVGCTGEDFMDAYHFLPSCDKKMIKYCFSSAPAWAGLL